mmetsp:Transcript_37203/g.54773  ORF Transcript_37203/g.54773 Transcript_37203/m.54773 type:complete len:894 (+) Transcript_37203:447-3128(+)
MSSQPHPSPHTTLTPAWYRGGSGKGGFQPPPAVPSDASGNVIAGGSSGGGRHHTTRERSGSAGGSSVGSGGGGGNPTYSALVMGDNGGDSHGGVEEQGGAGMGSPRHLKQKREGGGNSRSDALLGSSGGGRSGSGSFHRSSSGGERGWGSSAPGGGSSGSTGIKPGRSLADLAARATQSGLSRTRSGCHAYDRESSGGGEPYRGRPESLQQRSSSGGYHGESGSSQPQKPLKPVIRYTRERLLSLRPNPSPPGDEIPIHLKHLAGIVILASEPQDPVSFDEFDADEIWAQAKERPRGSIGSAPPIRPSSSGGAISSGLPPSINTPSSGSSAITRASLGSAVANTTNGGGRWQRGVALPPASEDPLGRGGKASEAETPDELWDDPLATSTSGAAPDFSQFGVPLLDDDDGGAPLVNSSSGSMFDLGKMSEAARKFEEELHGPQKVEGEDPPDDNPDNTHMTTVDPRRPLASLGTTIRSGSGEDVNVFEDFEAPPSPEETSDHTSSTDTPEEIPKTEDNAETNANESSDPSQPDSSTSTSSEPVQSEMTSSNLLMQMIGVVGSGESSAAGLTPWGNIGGDNAENDPTSTPASIACVKSTYVPSNPWDTPSTSMTDGMDLTTRLETAMSEQKARETRKQVEEDQRRQKEAEAEKQRLLQKQQEEEVQRQATIKAQQEAQQQHALRAQQQSQQAQQPQQQQQQQQQQQPQEPQEQESEPKSQDQLVDNRAESSGSVSAGKDVVDYTRLPAKLDSNFDKFDKFGALRATKIKLGELWHKTSQNGLLSKPQTNAVGKDAQRKERSRAFDLLDALSKSGALVLSGCTLHVVVAATHCFDLDLLNTVVQDNINPIDRVEASGLIMASTIFGAHPSELVRDGERERISDAQLSDLPPSDTNE